MRFTLTLDLLPGTTYAEIKRQLDLVSHRFPDDAGSKPDGHHRVDLCIISPDQIAAEDVVGNWRID